MIAIDRVTKRFDKRAVLDELTLSIDAGDRIALIGSNGAGKTTLFRALLGHYRHAGQIRFDDAKARRRDVGVLGRVAFVPQLPPPLRMPVGELLGFVEKGAVDDLRARLVKGLIGGRSHLDDRCLYVAAHIRFNLIGSQIIPDSHYQCRGK